MTKAPQKESPHDDRELRQIQAWMALVLPLLAWLSQVYIAFVIRRASAAFHLTAAGVQTLLLLGGLFLGIWALVKGGRGGAGVIAPATIGLLVSTGTLLLIGLLTVAALR